MDTFAAGALASLPPNEKIMEHKPRKSSDFIITTAMKINILFTGLTFVALLISLLIYYKDDSGEITPLNLSRFFTVFVLLQFWNMFNAKAFATGKSAFHKLGKSIGFILVATIILTGQILIVQFGGNVFRTVPLSLNEWFLIIGSTSIVLWIGEAERFFKGTKRSKITP